MKAHVLLKSYKDTAREFDSYKIEEVRDSELTSDMNPALDLFLKANLTLVDIKSLYEELKTEMEKIRVSYLDINNYKIHRVTEAEEYSSVKAERDINTNTFNIRRLREKLELLSSLFYTSIR